MKTIACVNFKGGTGKTTCSVSLAAGLAERGHSVLVIDLDPQGSASHWIGNGVPSDGGLFDVIAEDAPLGDCIEESKVAGVSIVPAPRNLGSIYGKGVIGGESALARALAKLPEDAFDVVFLDCPPAAGLLSVGALVAADGVLIPVEVSPMALAGVADLLEMVEAVKDRLNAKLEVVGALLACRVDSRTILARDVREALQGSPIGEKLFGVEIRESVRVREAYSWGKSILEHDPEGNASADYRAATVELEARLGLAKGDA